MPPSESAPASSPSIETRAQILRREFDASFVAMPRLQQGGQQAFLAIGTGAIGWALRLDDLAGIHRRRHITPLPGAPRDLIGIANLGGTVIPVYDLRALLHVDDGDAPAAWIAVTAPPLQVGLAFDRFDGYVLRDAQAGDAPTLHTGDDASARAIVDIRALLDTLKTRIQTRA